MKGIKISLLISFVTLVGFFSGCQKQHNIEDLKSKINAANEKFAEAMLASNPESLFPMYAEDAISLPSYQPMLKGLEAIKAKAEMDKEHPMKMNSFALTSTDVLVNGDFVADIGTYTLSIEMADVPGGEWADHGKYLTLFEIQKDGSLLIKAETWNTDTNPWEDMMKNQEEKK